MAMNRKERRALEKKQGKVTSPVVRPAAVNTQNAEYFQKLGLSLRTEGKDAEAIEPLKKALKFDNSLADVHFALAMISRNKPELNIDMEDVNRAITNKKRLLSSYSAIMVILRQKRQYKEAVICQEEICRLMPEDAWALMDLGLLLNIAGEPERATVEMSRALNMNPQDKVIKAVYSSSISSNTFSVFYPEVKQAILECFKDIYDVHLRNFWFPWINLMMRDPAFGAISTAKILDEAAFTAWADNLDEEAGKFLADPYFIGGLRLLVIANSLIETILTRLRKYICLNLRTLIANGRINLFEKFLYALAEQCFFNEYVYALTYEEEQIVTSLGESTDKTKIGLLACYMPLYKVMQGKADLLHKLAKDDPVFAHLVKTQFDDPTEEDRLKKTLPVFGNFANKVSHAVQNQYEENPYPRWTTIATTPLPYDDLLFDEKTKNLPFKILIAGCGTGRHAIATAVRYPDAKVTAIDLSRASLAYGLRKARECGMAERIDFVHADILSMKEWPGEFDIIESSGVLHHMEDPFLGWQTLTDKLKPNGLFNVGLYSDIARQPIVRARNYIHEKSYPPTLEGIRACRQAFLSLPPTDPIWGFVVQSGDFYTTSAVRDLIFHVQEHRMTLPQIKDMLNQLGLRCLKFILSNPDILYRYDKMFPQDLMRNNLENWELFEKKNPLTFAGMYQFWCQKISLDKKPL